VKVERGGEKAFGCRKEREQGGLTADLILN
jgi:hypothetical protein